MTIRKEGSQFVVRSKKGRNLGASPTKAGAQKRLAQVEFFKHRDQSRRKPRRGLLNG